jgi:hypothetical protein
LSSTASAPCRARVLLGSGVAVSTSTRTFAFAARSSGMRSAPQPSGRPRSRIATREGRARGPPAPSASATRAPAADAHLSAECEDGRRADPAAIVPSRPFRSIPPIPQRARTQTCGGTFTDQIPASLQSANRRVSRPLSGRLSTHRALHRVDSSHIRKGPS